MDWNKLKKLLQMPASATNPERDHELAAMVPDLLWAAACNGNREAQKIHDAQEAMRKPQLSEAAAKLLERLKGSAMMMQPIYVDELPAANELVKAGLATFPANEYRYSSYSSVPARVKYLNVAVMDDGGFGSWAAEGTLPPLGDGEIIMIQNVAEHGEYIATRQGALRVAENLKQIGILTNPSAGYRYAFTPAVLERHMRQAPTPTPTPREYRMVVRAERGEASFGMSQ